MEAPYYFKAGMRYSGNPDDPAAVSAHRPFHSGWLKAAILLANLVVWLEAAIRAAG